MLNFIKNQLFGKNNKHNGNTLKMSSAAQVEKPGMANKTKPSSFPSNYLDPDSMFK